VEAKVLVVDDSAVDRKLIKGLLEKYEDWQVFEASDGFQALSLVETLRPDVVVADLVMPRMNGRELMEAIRRRFPETRVILVTGRGSEQVAARVVHHGAAGYVPKRLLAEHLPRLVEKLVAGLKEQQTLARLMQFLRRFEAKFVLRSDPDSVAKLCAYLGQTLQTVTFVSGTDRTRLVLALQEALWNALYHGNLELGSRLHELAPRELNALIRERLRQSPYCERKIVVEVELSPEQARCVVRDEGQGFDPNSLPDPTAPENVFRPGGRGILLMRTYVDEVHYNALGNEVTLVKRFGGHANAA